MKESLLGSQASGQSGKLCVLTAVLALNLAILISSIGVGIYVGHSLQSKQDRTFEVSS